VVLYRGLFASAITSGLGIIIGHQTGTRAATGLARSLRQRSAPFARQQHACSLGELPE
jgi:hypothetical protein